MPRDTLTGSRIRERRGMAGMRQADLARQIGISASYLNLIEHNRRRIGGKLLVDIAGVLGVEPSMLTEGAEAALIAQLREAAADAGVAGAEVDRADEFAGRFPGWSEVLASAHRRIGTLERTVEILSDRLTHDPHLAASLHEVLSTAAAIRSTASILAETGELKVEWRDKFHNNLNQDSARLAESSKALVRYLDESEGVQDLRRAPREEVESFIAGQDYHFPALEDAAVTVEELVQNTEALTSPVARKIAQGVLALYAADAAAMPLAKTQAALKTPGLDPLALADAFGTDLPSVFRRLATLPHGTLSTEVGLVVADASGSFLFRKPVDGFALPRFGSGCGLWPLFAALGQPYRPIQRRVEQAGRNTASFDCMAMAQAVGPPRFDRDPLYHATMLIVPVAKSDVSSVPALRVGSTCRVCPSRGCSARREPSILNEVF